MSEDKEDTTGYITAGEYAEQENMQDEEVVKLLRNGSLEGRLINSLWYVKKGAKSGEAGTRVNVSRGNIANVKIVGLDIPFGDIFWLTLKAAGASLIILAIPILIIAAANS